jgi:hypothetical protein
MLTKQVLRVIGGLVALVAAAMGATVYIAGVRNAAEANTDRVLTLEAWKDKAADALSTARAGCGDVMEFRAWRVRIDPVVVEVKTDLTHIRTALERIERARTTCERAR